MDHMTLEILREFGAASAWLMSPTADQPDPPSASQIDGTSAILFENWPVLPVTLPRLLSWIGGNEPNRESVRLLKSRAAAVQCLGQAQNAVLELAIPALGRADVPYVLLKGTAVRLGYYGQPDRRCGLDIDIGVPAGCLERARAVFESVGFEAAQWVEARYRFEPADPALRAEVEKTHYELGFLVRRCRVLGLPPESEGAIREQIGHEPSLWHLTPEGELACYVSVDVHHGIAQEIPITPIIEARRPVRYKNRYWYIPRPSWALFHLIFKTYWEGVHNYGVGAYQYADICRVAPTLDDDEIQHFRQLISQWRLEAAAWFVLRRLPSEFGIGFSPAMAAFVDEMSQPRQGTRPSDNNDRGDMWPKLWGSF
jgi:hypothetical protein